MVLALLNGLIAACAIDSTGDGQAEAATSMPLSRATATATATPATHITPTAAGSTAPPSVGAPDKWSLWVDGPHLRGADLHPCRLFTADGCAQPITRQDIQDLRNLGANLINASYPGVFAQGKATIHYPSVVDDAGVKITFDRTWLEENYRPVREFARQHDVPIYVGEFGVLRWVPGAAAFLSDQTDLFEQYGWNYAVYAWRGDEPYFDGFNLEYGPDPENHTIDLDNPLLDVFRDRWAQNVHSPERPPERTNAIDRTARP